MQRRIEEHARDAAGGMGEIERVGSIAAHHAAARDFGRALEIDIQRFDDRQGAYRRYTGDTSVRPLRIQISASGGVRMCDPAVASPDSRACNP